MVNKTHPSEENGVNIEWLNVDVATLIGGRVCDGLKLGVGESGTAFPFLFKQTKRILIIINIQK